jgi:hypothetical protein
MRPALSQFIASDASLSSMGANVFVLLLRLRAELPGEAGQLFAVLVGGVHRTRGEVVELALADQPKITILLCPRVRFILRVQLRSDHIADHFVVGILAQLPGCILLFGEVQRFAAKLDVLRGRLPDHRVRRRCCAGILLEVAPARLGQARQAPADFVPRAFVHHLRYSFGI